MEEVRQRRQKGVIRGCFADDLLEGQKASGLNDEQLGYLAGSLLEAGSDTTSATVLCFILAMLKWPEVQRKAQAELDRVIGAGRLPTVADRDSLPYVAACALEVSHGGCRGSHWADTYKVLRWHPVAIGGVPHATTQADSYKGYEIPEGAMVIANTWSVINMPANFYTHESLPRSLHMDETAYGPSPEVFDPSRFLNGNASVKTDSGSRQLHYGFGAGRRICSG